MVSRHLSVANFSIISCNFKSTGILCSWSNIFQLRTNIITRSSYRKKIINHLACSKSFFLQFKLQKRFLYSKIDKCSTTLVRMCIINIIHHEWFISLTLEVLCFMFLISVISKQRTENDMIVFFHKNVKKIAIVNWRNFFRKLISSII